MFAPLPIPPNCANVSRSRFPPPPGIPIGQQNLIFKERELADELEMRDIPLVKGSRLKFVLGMKGGPVSARRSANLPAECDASWFDLNDIMNPRCVCACLT